MGFCHADGDAAPSSTLPETPCPSRPARSDCRSGTPALCACSISLRSLFLLGELSYHPRLTHPAPLCPATFRLNAGSHRPPRAPGHPCHPERGPPPPWCRSGGGNQQCPLPPRQARRRCGGTRKTHFSEGCYERAGCWVL